MPPTDRRDYAEVLARLNTLATKEDIKELTKTVRTHIDTTCTTERINIHSEIATLKARIIGISSFFGLLGGLIMILMKALMK